MFRHLSITIILAVLAFQSFLSCTTEDDTAGTANAGYHPVERTTQPGRDEVPPLDPSVEPPDGDVSNQSDPSDGDDAHSDHRDDSGSPTEPEPVLDPAHDRTADPTADWERQDDLLPPLTPPSPPDASRVIDPSAVRWISVMDFQDRVIDGDWSPAIQAAIDSVSWRMGHRRGGVILFPPGDYRIDKTIILGRDAAHWGMHLLGYGARLIGSPVLDQTVTDAGVQARMEPLEGSRRDTMENDLGQGGAILELRNPPNFEGAAFTIEGLIFDRQRQRQGVGIKVYGDHVPKGTVFRSVKIFNQDIGVHINYAWQFYFTDCMFRENRVGLLGQNHFNNISIINSIFRRNHEHGLQIGPERRSWESSNINVTGSIFESNGGYGILNHSGVPLIVTGSYFEANGNGLGLYAGNGLTTIDGCFFSTGAGPEHVVNDHHHEAFIIIGRTRSIQFRNNRYFTRQNTPRALIVDTYLGGASRFDAEPRVKDGVLLPNGLKIAADDGLGYWEYDRSIQRFRRRDFDAR